MNGTSVPFVNITCGATSRISNTLVPSGITSHADSTNISFRSFPVIVFSCHAPVPEVIRTILPACAFIVIAPDTTSRIRDDEFAVDVPVRTAAVVRSEH